MDERVRMKKFWSKKRLVWAIIVGVVAIVIIVTITLFVIFAGQTVTVNGVTYKGKSLEEAKALYDKNIADKAKYTAGQKDKCDAKGSDYIYVVSSDECITTSEYTERDRIAQKAEYEKKQAQYKSNPELEVIDAYNDYSTISTACKTEIMEAQGYSHMYEIATGKAQSKITKDNIISISGNAAQLKIDVDYVPSTLVQSDPSLHQERAFFKGKACTVDMQKDHRDIVESYVNG